MKKVLFFLPAAAFTMAAIVLNIALRAFTPLWYGWTALLWISGFFLTKGKIWGGLFGLLPAGHLLYMSTQYTGQVIRIEMPLGLGIAVYVLASIAVVWKTGGRLR